jgi:hypothetical protein
MTQYLAPNVHLSTTGSNSEIQVPTGWFRTESQPPVPTVTCRDRQTA